MANKHKRDNHPLLPRSVIEAAIAGDIDAINSTVRHYQGYIIALSTQKLYDETGIPHLCVNEDLKKHLETKLITAILGFKIKST